MRISGCRARARAMDSRCFCPPDTLAPPWAMGAWTPWGSFATNSVAWARSRALYTASSEASPALWPKRTLLSTSPENSTARWVT